MSLFSNISQKINGRLHDDENNQYSLLTSEILYIVLDLQYVHGSLEDPKTLTHHKLIHAATERVLTDTKTVADENLKDKGT